MAKGKQRYKCRACKRFFILDREPQTGKAKIRPTKEDVCHRLNG
jgi:transposase-like protein